jgi:hypothetical protein
VLVKEMLRRGCSLSEPAHRERGATVDKASIEYGEVREQDHPHAGVVAIPLSPGNVALVDAEDWERIGEYQWQVFRSRNTKYAVRYVRVFMHGELLGELEEGLEVDHKNGNGLDNRRSNLRVATRSQNAQNQQKQNRATSSRFKGVHWNKGSKKWIARIGIDKKRVTLGSFGSEEEAGRAYDAAAQKHFGGYARLNFPTVPHACNSGWVSMEVETEDGGVEEVLYLCRRCSEAEETS